MQESFDVAEAPRRLFVSADDHVIEHPRVWTDRLSRATFGDRIPHLARDADGGDVWVVDGRRRRLADIVDVGATLSDRSASPVRSEEIPALAASPAARAGAMRADGVDFSVLYPTVAGLAGETFGRITDPELELACVRAYNDWLIEEWAAANPRYLPQCIVPLFPVEATVAEIRRAVGRGHRGVIFPAIPQHLRDSAPHINDPAYDPVWQTCQELGVPVCFHSGSSPDLELQPYEGFSPQISRAFKAITRPAGSSVILSNMLMSRALIKHPKLNFVFPESSLGWVMFVLEAADYQADRVGLSKLGYDVLPSEIFRRQCFITSWYDNASLRHCLRHIGPDNILWSSNFPHGSSHWPASRAAIAHCFDGVSAHDTARILSGNAARLYGIDLSVIARTAEAANA